MFLYPSSSAQVKQKMAAYISALLFVPFQSGVVKAITNLPYVSLKIPPAPSLPRLVSELP